MSPPAVGIQVGFSDQTLIVNNYCWAHCVTSDTSPLTAISKILALLWSVSGSRRRFCPGSLFAELLRRIRSSEALIAIVTGNNYPRCSRCGVWPGGQCVAIRLYPPSLPWPITAIFYTPPRQRHLCDYIVILPTSNFSTQTRFNLHNSVLIGAVN